MFFHCWLLLLHSVSSCKSRHQSDFASLFFAGTASFRSPTFLPVLPHQPLPSTHHCQPSCTDHFWHKFSVSPCHDRVAILLLADTTIFPRRDSYQWRPFDNVLTFRLNLNKFSAKSHYFLSTGPGSDL